MAVNSDGTFKRELRYEPWGETRYSSGTTPTDFRYTGQKQTLGNGLVRWALTEPPSENILPLVGNLADPTWASLENIFAFTRYYSETDSIELLYGLTPQPLLEPLPQGAYLRALALSPQGDQIAFTYVYGLASQIYVAQTPSR